MEDRAGGLTSRCVLCGERAEGLVSRCPRCGGPMSLDLGDVRWEVRREVPSMWRYEAMLPRFERRVSLGEGLTPFRRVGGTLLKLEGRNPTGSYADRASSVIASYVASAGAPGWSRVKYYEDFAYSFARYVGGISGVEVVIDDPTKIDPQEVVALVDAGAKVSFGPSVGAVDYANPLSIEGLKTIAFEIAEFHPRADAVLVPAETGLLALSVWKGLREADLNAEVVAVTLRGSEGPSALEGLRDLSVREEDPEEAVRGLVALARFGIRAKVLSAAAFALAEEVGGAVAIISAAQRRFPSRGRADSGIRSEVMRALGELGEATAYDLWGRLRRFTLRGIYKAVESLEAEGVLCARYRMRGNRRIKVYSPCPGIGRLSR